MKKMVISFDEAVETLKEHYGVSDVEIVDLPANRNETSAKVKGGVRGTKAYWQFGMCFDPEGQLKTTLSVAVTKLRLLYKESNIHLENRLHSWIGNPKEVLAFFEYVENNNELPPMV